MSQLPIVPRKPSKKRASLHNPFVNPNFGAAIKEKTDIDIYQTAKKKSSAQIYSSQITKRPQKPKARCRLDKHKIIKNIYEETLELHNLVKQGSQIKLQILNSLKNARNLENLVRNYKQKAAQKKKQFEEQIVIMHELKAQIKGFQTENKLLDEEIIEAKMAIENNAQSIKKQEEEIVNSNQLKKKYAEELKEDKKQKQRLIESTIMSYFQVKVLSQQKRVLSKKTQKLKTIKVPKSTFLTITPQLDAVCTIFITFCTVSQPDIKKIKKLSYFSEPISQIFQLNKFSALIKSYFSKKQFAKIDLKGKLRIIITGENKKQIGQVVNQYFVEGEIESEEDVLSLQFLF